MGSRVLRRPEVYTTFDLEQRAMLLQIIWLAADASEKVRVAVHRELRARLEKRRIKSGEVTATLKAVLEELRKAQGIADVDIREKAAARESQR